MVVNESIEQTPVLCVTFGPLENSVDSIEIQEKAAHDECQRELRRARSSH